MLYSPLSNFLDNLCIIHKLPHMSLTNFERGKNAISKFDIFDYIGKDIPSALGTLIGKGIFGGSGKPKPDPVEKPEPDKPDKPDKEEELNTPQKWNAWENGKEFLEGDQQKLKRSSSLEDLARVREEFEESNADREGADPIKVEAMGGIEGEADPIKVKIEGEAEPVKESTVGKTRTLQQRRSLESSNGRLMRLARKYRRKGFGRAANDLAGMAARDEAMGGGGIRTEAQVKAEQRMAGDSLAVKSRQLDNLRGYNNGKNPYVRNKDGVRGVRISKEDLRRGRSYRR